MILELLNASTPTFDLEFMKPVATEMERKIGEERQKAGGSLGALVGTLQWDNALNNTDLRCDLDFYCFCPNGDRIGYSYQREAGGGHWDVDRTCKSGGLCIENIYFKDPPRGVYEFKVHHYSGATEIPFSVTLISEIPVTVDGVLAKKGCNIVKDGFKHQHSKDMIHMFDVVVL